MRRSRVCWIRHLRGVQAKPSLSAGHLIDVVLDRTRQSANITVSQRYLHESEAAKSSFISAQHQAIQLRLGGAQMLASTRQQIGNVNEAHPLFFSQTTPKEAGLCMALVSALRKINIMTLTELQGAMIPLMLKGKHVIAHAETGTGKSFGVALATANRIIRQQINYRLHTVILVPTQELALQYDKWLKHFGGCASQIVQPAVESIPFESQLAKLHNIQPHVLVGTPQRVADIVRLSPNIIGESLRKRVDCIVLDEADVILSAEVQFGRQSITGADLVDRLYRANREEVPAQVVATSATIDGATAQRLNAWMRNDKAVRITTSFVEHTIPDTITFYFFSTALRSDPKQTLEKVLRLLFKQHRKPRILIFTSEDPETLRDVIRTELKIPEADRLLAGCELADVVQEKPDPANPNKHISARQLVGRNKEIYLRNDSNIAKLNDGRLLMGIGGHDISRGMHVSGISHVVIYGDAPTASQFVHCAGRTGRMGKKGEVVSIFPPSSGKAMQAVCAALELPFHLCRDSQIDGLLAMMDHNGDAVGFSAVSPPSPSAVDAEGTGGEGEMPSPSTASTTEGSAVDEAMITASSLMDVLSNP